MYKIAICDDNVIFRKFLKNEIEKNAFFPPESRIYEYEQGEQMLMEMEGVFDLAIIDIQLPKRNGFSIAEELFRMNPTAVLVYCSGVVMPTDEAFLVQPYRYLLKQADSKKMQKDMEDILKEMQARQRQCYCFLSEGREEIRIDVEDILYFAAVYNGCVIKCYEVRDAKRELRTIYSKERVQKIEEKVCRGNLFRIQRSYIVNFDYVVRVRDNAVLMEDGVEICISRKKRQEFHKLFTKYIGMKYRRS